MLYLSSCKIKLFIGLAIWRIVRVAEGARLESEYTVRPYREFESLILRLKLKCIKKSFRNVVPAMILKLFFC